MFQAIIPLAAKPQGSKTPFKRGNKIVLVEASKGLKERRAEFIKHLIDNAGEWRQPDKDTPLGVVIIFHFVKPKTAKRPHMTTVPDIDKTARFVLDCLTQSGVIYDDRQITVLNLQKVYSPRDATIVSVQEL